MMPSLRACAIAAAVQLAYLEHAIGDPSAMPSNHLKVAMLPRSGVHAMIELFGARGFTVTDLKPLPTGYTLRLVGNRDYWDTHTIGSAFDVWVERDGDGSMIRVVGRPTVDHVDVCSSASTNAHADCIALSLPFTRGREEGQLIRGVFDELEFDTGAH